MKPAQEGKKTNQRPKTRPLHSHQVDVLFKMQRRPRAERKKKREQEKYTVITE